MITALNVALAILLVVVAALLLAALRRGGDRRIDELQTALAGLASNLDRTERALRDELARGREEAARADRDQREELAAATRATGDSLLARFGELAASQQSQLEALRATVEARLDQIRDGAAHHARLARDESAASLKAFNDSVVLSMGEMAATQRAQLELFATRLSELSTSNGEALDRMRTGVEERLAALQRDSSERLEQMRQTVDEKLQGTLEKRLGESFRAVSERLEQVHKGLGEMQSLASGVGDLKKVLVNVKARGTWGEMQLGNLLEQLLTPEQYAANVATRRESRERVEYAIKLPGRDEMEGKVVWLPIDAKFPREDYERLVDASERADAAGVEEAGRQLELRLKAEARDIRDKYLDPPGTTDFAILFLPIEGLYAEVLRRPGLVDQLQREFRVTVAGPTTLAALLNSLQMGFRTLAIQKRSSEVWAVLGAVKTEFGKFGDVLGKVQKKLQEASHVVDDAATRTRQIERKLRQIQELPAPAAAALLGSEGHRSAESVDGESGQPADQQLPPAVRIG